MHTFEITIQRRAGNSWPVVVEERAAGTFLPMRTEGVLALELDDLRAASLSDYGEILGRALFREGIRDAFAHALVRSDDLVHVLLNVEDPGLRSLRWELLNAPMEGRWAPLGMNQRTPYSLYVASSTDRRFPPLGRGDLRALILIASPSNLDAYRLRPFDEHRAFDAVRSALGDLPVDGLGTIPGAVGPPTLDTLCERVIGESYTLLHVISHSILATSADEPVLYLANTEGQVDAVSASRLIGRLSQLRGARGLPHLVFLGSNETAQPDEGDALRLLGQRMVRELGIPAVVAMTEKMTVATAQALAEGFYRRLRDHGEVDRALVEACAGVTERHDLTVAALYSRLGGQPLFSDAADRQLTVREIKEGLSRVRSLFAERAPAWLEVYPGEPRSVFDKAATDLVATLHAEFMDLGEQAKDRLRALGEVGNLCDEALDLGFHALALGRDPPAYDARCPFRGFYPFRVEDREFFFGREALVTRLRERLAEHPFLAVLGPSGSGKSSVVLAGLIPALQMQEKEFRLAYLTPGSDPLNQLETNLQGNAHPSLLVVDQFEELFTLCTDEARRRDFLARLLKLPEQIRVILTMRADFWWDCAPYRELKECLQARQELIAPMDATELRRSMEEQATKVGLRFEADLSNTILDDFQGEPGAMPLLQHALLELWKRRHGRWLRAEEYRAIGGVKKAIAETAEAVFRVLPSDVQVRARDIFMRLTRLDEADLKAEYRRDTRSRVGLAELTPAGSDPAQTRNLVMRLVDARLLVTSINSISEQEEVEVGHEALIRYWPRLRSWLEEDRTSLRIRWAVREAAREWETGSKDVSLLVHRGARLHQAKALMEGGPVKLNNLELQYLKACVAHQATTERWSIRDFLPIGGPKVGNLFQTLTSGLFRLFRRERADRPLTAIEIAQGVLRFQELLLTQAPRLPLADQTFVSDLLRLLDGGAQLSDLERRVEFKAALKRVEQLCTEIVEMDFRALALGHDPPVYDPRCPFPGLNAFQTNDRVFFFGREDLCAGLIKRLEGDRFVALHGPSGSGKSSLVLGFLFPEMQKVDPGLELEYLTPTADPRSQFAVKVDTAVGRRTVTFIDQFEEVFTLCRDEDRRSEFIDRVLDLPASRLVIVTIRSDFRNRCETYPALRRALEDHGVSVVPMGVDELKVAMTHQSEAVGLRYEKGLMERILDDVCDEPGRMPLHQHALRELWMSRHGRLLAHEGYLAIGKVHGAIAKTAEDVFKKLSLGDQSRVRNIFVRLTRLGEDPAPGEARRNTRRRVAMEELVPAGEDPDRVVQLVASLANARLVVTNQNLATGREEVEVAHEALIRHWSLMREWLDESALPELRLRESLRDAAKAWDFSGRRDDSLLVHRGDRLAWAERLANGSDPRFNRFEQAYIRECAELRQRGETERLAREAIESALVRAEQVIASRAGVPQPRATATARRRVEVHIHVFKADPDPDEDDSRKTYPVQLTVPGLRKFYTQSRICLDKTRLDSQAADYERYGQSLGEMVFAADALGPVYNETVKQARAAGDKLRVSLQFEAPELHAVHWERLHHKVDAQWLPLGSNAETPFSRYVLTPGYEPLRPLTDRPVRVLVVIANPPGLDQFHLARIPDTERDALCGFCESLNGTALQFLETGTARPATLRELGRALAEGFHIVHFHTHGALVDGAVALYFDLEGDPGRVHLVNSQEIVNTFALLDEAPRLCFFAACESGAHSHTDGFLPLGPSLVALGRVSAVVAMTKRVGMTTARLFADQFYRRLLSHGVIDLAINEARASILDRWDWSVPVLFSGLSDNQIFSPSDLS